MSLPETESAWVSRSVHHLCRRNHIPQCPSQSVSLSSLLTLLCCFFKNYLYFSPKDIHLLILQEWEEERGEETSMWERNIDWLLPVCALTKDWTHDPGMWADQESNLQPRYVLWPGIKPTTSWYAGQRSNQVNHLVRALCCFFTSINIQTEATFPCSFY